MTSSNQTAGAYKGALRLIALSCVWALAMMASATLNLFLLDRVVEAKSELLVAFFGIGALVAFLMVAWVLRRAPQHWRTGQRFAFAFIALSLVTIGATALIFALHFRAYFAEWHDDHVSVRLIFETVFTLLSAVYQFLVLGLRLYIPQGLVALLVASWAFATKRI